MLIKIVVAPISQFFFLTKNRVIITDNWPKIWLFLSYYNIVLK